MPRVAESSPQFGTQPSVMFLTTTFRQGLLRLLGEERHESADHSMPIPCHKASGNQSSNPLGCSASLGMPVMECLSPSNAP